jgi:replicative DNA helicase
MDIEDYAHIVRRLSLMRHLVDAGGKIKAIGYQADPNVESSLSQAEDILFKLRQGQVQGELVHVRQVLDKYFEAPKPEAEAYAKERMPYVFTGFTGLDDFLGGLQRSDLIIVAGRPSMGKTSFAISTALNIAIDNNACVAFFSQEMSRDSLVLRMLASESGVNTRRIRFHTEFEEKRDDLRWGEEEKRIMEAAGKLSEASIYLDDSPQLRIVEMRSKARRLNFEHGIDLIILDYLQLVQGEGRIENRVQEVSYISRSLKAIARELDVPVLAVSQLSRAPESRMSHIPQLSDLRESGSIEQDADVVLFIYRDEYYYDEETWSSQHPEKKYPKEEAAILISKNRNGPTDQIKLGFRHNIAKFYNIVSEEPSLL